MLGDGYMLKTKQVTGNMTLLMGWILQHFPCISGWASVSDYSEDMSRATTFILFRGNQTIEPHRVYLDRLVVEDMHFNNYFDHCETQLFDEIIIHSR
ncbi:unnamed protein product [Lathyrus oleraceus]